VNIPLGKDFLITLRKGLLCFEWVMERSGKMKGWKDGEREIERGVGKGGQGVVSEKRTEQLRGRLCQESRP